MHSYIREHTAGSIIRAAFEIYFRHFPTVMIVYFLPITPFVVLQTVALHMNMPQLFTVSLILGMVASLFASAAITLLISDACLGNQIGILRYYRRIFGVLLAKLLATGLLQLLALAIAMLLFVIPFFFVLVWLMFSTTVVVLEGAWAVQAFKRSKELGNTKHWRNFGVLLVFMAVGGLIGFGIGVIVEIVTAGAPGIGSDITVEIVRQLMAPLSFIGIILLYYDLRVRKEAYDLQGLAEDLKH